MQVLKVELQGVTTSFRYPHFLVGRQPSFTMPPPATIYGHIASALGGYPNPDSFRFAYTFVHKGSVDDFEHTWMIELDKRQKVEKDYPHPPNILAEMKPTTRQLFFQPRLTLYLETPDLQQWAQAFREPQYPVLLGRSQDLASYKSVQIISLEQNNTGYYDHTLLPWSYRPRVRVGAGILMPRFINPNNRRDVIWARYVTLEHRIFHPQADEKLPDSITVNSLNEELWIDPYSEVIKNRQRVIVWHSLRGQESEQLESSVVT
jgi:CRISPR-associated protein Cas5t